MSTLPAPRPARLRDIPRAAWILSRAFASTSYLGGHIHAQALARLHALAPLPVFASPARSTWMTPAWAPSSWGRGTPPGSSWAGSSPPSP